MKDLLSFSAIILILCSFAYCEIREATCVFDPDDGPEDFRLSGEIIIQEDTTEDTVLVHGYIDGFTNCDDKFHGIHINEKNKLGDECNKTKDHFNPAGLRHGSPTDAERHVGDLGNIRAIGGDDNKMAYVLIYDSQITLDKESDNNVEGRSIVIDEYENDLGINRDFNEEAATTGENTGRRIACCKIKEAEVGDIYEHFDGQVRKPDDQTRNSLFQRRKRSARSVKESDKSVKKSAKTFKKWWKAGGV